MLLNELARTSNKWANANQPQLVEAIIVATGSTDTTYTIEFRNRARAKNVSGPSGLSVGNAVVVAGYPGRVRKYTIMQRTSGGGTRTPTIVQLDD